MGIRALRFKNLWVHGGLTPCTYAEEVNDVK